MLSHLRANALADLIHRKDGLLLRSSKTAHIDLLAPSLDFLKRCEPMQVYPYPTTESRKLWSSRPPEYTPYAHGLRVQLLSILEHNYWSPQHDKSSPPQEKDSGSTMADDGIESMSELLILACCDKKGRLVAVRTTLQDGPSRDTWYYARELIRLSRRVFDHDRAHHLMLRDIYLAVASESDGDQVDDDYLAGPHSTDWPLLVRVDDESVHDSCGLKISRTREPFFESIPWKTGMMDDDDSLSWSYSAHFEGAIRVSITYQKSESYLPPALLTLQCSSWALDRTGLPASDTSSSHEVVVERTCKQESIITDLRTVITLPWQSHKSVSVEFFRANVKRTGRATRQICVTLNVVDDKELGVIDPGPKPSADNAYPRSSPQAAVRPTLHKQSYRPSTTHVTSGAQNVDRDISERSNVRDNARLLPRSRYIPDRSRSPPTASRGSK